MHAAVDLRELLQPMQGSSDYSLIGLRSLVAAVAVFSRTGRPDIAARADGHTRLSPTGAYGSFGGYVGWYERAINETRAALGDQRNESLAAQEATRPLQTFVLEMIECFDELLAGSFIWRSTGMSC